MRKHRAAHLLILGLSSLPLGATSTLGGGLEQDRLTSAPFFRDTSLELYLRFYCLGRDNFDGSKVQSWAGGGWLSYRSGLLANTLYIGATFFTSQPIYAPADEGGTLLLTSHQNALSTLGEAYVGAKIAGQELVVGRQSIDTPLINRRDNRMIPITFEGATLRSSTDKDAKFEYIVGYLRRFRPRDSNDFNSISDGFGVDDSDAGTPFAWFRLRPADGLTFVAENYWVEDIINTGYVEGVYQFPRPSVGPQYTLAANVITQNSVGSDLLANGDSFFTYQASARLTADFGELALMFIASTTGTGAAINFPLGTKPNYTDLQQASFDRAGEDAVGIGATLKLDRFGLADVTAAAWYGWGWDAIDATTNASLPDRQELDLSLRYRPTNGMWKGLSLWARYGVIFSNEVVRDDQPELRLILDYTIPLLR